jgi:hypothetical protein
MKIGRLPSRIGLLFPFLLLAALLCAAPALADVGPPPAHPAWSISPGDFVTQVQMVSEEVLLDIRPEEGNPADVEATFNMLNTGVADESFDVWFPLGEELYGGKAYRIYEVTDFKAWMDGGQAEVVIDDLDEEGLVWAHWPASFPAGEPVVIRVTYRAAAEMASDLPWHLRYRYILETGAGWKDVIEYARVTVQAPFLMSEPDWKYSLGDPYFVKPLGYATAGDRIVWTFYNLEPTAADNIEFDLIYPSFWEDIQAAQAAIDAGQATAETYYTLASRLSLWLTAFDLRQYVFRPEPPIAPDLDRVAPRMTSAFVEAFQQGMNDTHALRFFVENLTKYRLSIELPEIDGFFQAAVAARPEDEELAALYSRAVEIGLADGVVPAEATATSPPATPTPVPTGTPESPPEPAVDTPRTFVFLAAGVVAGGAGAALLVYLLLRRRIRG